jgi:hypothetical protein
MSQVADRAVDRLDELAGLRTYQGGNNLVDILDRILDKGLVVAGDIRVSLANVELLTVRIRLLVCSIDRRNRSA